MTNISPLKQLQVQQVFEKLFFLLIRTNHQLINIYLKQVNCLQITMTILGPFMNGKIIGVLKFRIVQSNSEELKEIYEVEEGLENRLYCAIESSSFLEFMQKLKTKRYTWTRLQRLCVHILTNTKKTDMAMTTEKASYLRLLGMTQRERIFKKEQITC